MAQPIRMTVRIEYVQEGDIVIGKGAVVDIVNDKNTGLVRLMFVDSLAIEGFYGDKVLIRRNAEYRQCVVCGDLIIHSELCEACLAEQIALANNTL